MPINSVRINFEVRRNFARSQSFMKVVTTLRLLRCRTRNRKVQLKKKNTERKKEKDIDITRK